MSVNKFKPHILVIPEDDANRQLANGFQLEVDSRQFQTMPEAGGWLNVISIFELDHIKAMRTNPQRHVVLLLDFDQDEQRRRKIKDQIPPDIQNRVFLLGVWSEPEALRKDLGSLEAIGQNLASECRDHKTHMWDHPLLHHNVDELARLERAVGGFLF